MAMKHREMSGNAAVIFLTAAGLVIVLLILWFGRSLFLLMFAGMLLSVMLCAISDFLKRRLHLPRGMALAITVTVSIGAIITFVLLFAPNVEAQVKSLWQSFPETLQQARTQLRRSTWGQRLLAQLPTASGMLSSGTQLAKRSMEAAFGVLGLIGDVVVIGFVGLYLAIDPERYMRGAVDLFPPTWRPSIWETMHAAGDSLRRWLVGKLSLMVFVGVSTAVGLWLLHIPLIAPLALLAAALDFIPNIGPIVSAVPAVLLALTVGPVHALWTAALYLAVQVIESYILQPFIQGKAVSLPPAVLISAQVLLGILLGPLGVVVATPLTVVLLVFIKRLYVGEVLERVESL